MKSNNSKSKILKKHTRFRSTAKTPHCSMPGTCLKHTVVRIFSRELGITEKSYFKTPKISSFVQKVQPLFIVKRLWRVVGTDVFTYNSDRNRDFAGRIRDGNKFKTKELLAYYDCWPHFISENLFKTRSGIGHAIKARERRTRMFSSAFFQQKRSVFSKFLTKKLNAKEHSWQR